MRDAEKLMSRCIYLNVLKATITVAKENETSSETLEKYASYTLSDFQPTSLALYPTTICLMYAIDCLVFNWLDFINLFNTILFSSFTDYDNEKKNKIE